MEETFIDNKGYDKISFKEHPLKKGGYEDRGFIQSDFLNTDLPVIKFIECEFTG